jgi:hypothetical protein
MIGVYGALFANRDDISLGKLFGAFGKAAKRY